MQTMSGINIPNRIVIIWTCIRIFRIKIESQAVFKSKPKLNIFLLNWVPVVQLGVLRRRRDRRVVEYRHAVPGPVTVAL